MYGGTAQVGFRVGYDIPKNVGMRESAKMRW